ncbi:hypothetical protein KIN20_004620 [Parelaphostrongylus tenuis]|uniref:Uncharacterized protein n=1 Tax=Parelaphostrongylus tenuis TaxID=148309 RepID=A0AAD5LYR9_PARTN|nr:hypothetical protein KIN20_004620 [Parelaphostrongylus tenuis]
MMVLRSLLLPKLVNLAKISLSDRQVRHWMVEPQNTAEQVKKSVAKSPSDSATANTVSKETQGVRNEIKKAQSKVPKECDKSARTARDMEFFTQEASVEEAAKITAIDADLNDFVMRAAELNTVVDPRLVRKGGNIDDAPHLPPKLQLRTMLDDKMRTREDTAEGDDKNTVKKEIKWGDKKCVVYEIKDQLTAEDGMEDALDLL